MIYKTYYEHMFHNCAVQVSIIMNNKIKELYIAYVFEYNLSEECVCISIYVEEQFAQ